MLVLVELACRAPLLGALWWQQRGRKWDRAVRGSCWRASSPLLVSSSVCSAPVQGASSRVDPQVNLATSLTTVGASAIRSSRTRVPVSVAASNKNKIKSSGKPACPNRHLSSCFLWSQLPGLVGPQVWQCSVDALSCPRYLEGTRAPAVRPFGYCKTSSCTANRMRSLCIARRSDPDQCCLVIGRAGVLYRGGDWKQPH